MTSKEQQAGTDQRDNACKEAAYRMWQALEMEGICVELSENPEREAWTKLPIDLFLAEMAERRRSPKIVFKPTSLGSELWSQSLTAYVYAGIELAFTRASRMPGGNHRRYAHELEKLCSWVTRQIECPSTPLPKHFVARTSVIFAAGVLDERRPQRVELLYIVEQTWPSNEAALQRLLEWMEDDLSDDRLLKKGRPSDYQRIVFAAEIANLWNRLTGRPISKKLGSWFERFVVACWKSGFPGGTKNTNFRRIFHNHLEEDPNPEPCRRCDCCKESKKCERKRYYGILI